MSIISKEYMDIILEEINETTGAIIDKESLIYAMENYYDTYVPNNFKTCKNDIIGVFKIDNKLKLVRLPLHRWQINYSCDERILSKNVLFNEEYKVLEESLNRKEILYKEGW